MSTRRSSPASTGTTTATAPVAPPASWVGTATGAVAAPLPASYVDPLAGVGRGGATPEDIAKAAMRGVTVAQSKDLDFRLKTATETFNSGMAARKPGESGAPIRERARAAFGKIEPWMADALFKEHATLGGAPVPAAQATRAGMTYDTGGRGFSGTQSFTQQSPEGWEGTFTSEIYKEATQDPASANSGQYYPDRKYLPAGAKAHDGSIVVSNPIIDAIPIVSNVYGGATGDNKQLIGGAPYATARNAWNGVVKPLGEEIVDASKAAWDGVKDAANYLKPDFSVPDTSGLDGIFGAGGGAGGGGTGGTGSGGGGSRTAPQLAARGPTSVSQMTPAEIAAIERVNAGTIRSSFIDPTTMAQTAQIGDVSEAEGERIGASQIDPTALADSERIGAAQISPAMMAQWERAQAGKINAEQADPAALAMAAQIRRNEQAQMRDKQLSVLQQLQDAADGKAPSVAQLMLRRAADENISNQRGLAAQARGPSIGLAAMNAATNIGNLNQKAALDQAMLRAQEMATARGQLGQATGDIRGADIGLETNQAGMVNAINLANQGAINARSSENAGLRQDANKTNLGVQTQVGLANQATGAQTSQFNAGQTNTQATQQAQLTQDAAKANQAVGAQTSQFNAGQLNTRATNQAQIDQDAAKANQATGLQISLANAQAKNAAATENARLAQQAYNLNATAENARALQQAQLEQDAAKTNLATATQVNLANANATNTRATSQAQLEQDASKTNVTATNTRNLADAETAKAIDIANQNAGLTMTGMDDQREASVRSNDTAITGHRIDIEKAKLAAATQAKIAENLFKTNVIGGGTAAVGQGLGLLSDERHKGRVQDGDDDIAAFLDAMGDKSKSFRYKDQSDPRAAKGQRWGQMAQDLEKTSVGKSIVHNDGGDKVIDTREAVGVMLAAIAQVNARLNKLDKRKGRN